MSGQNVWKDRLGSHTVAHGQESSIRTSQALASELAENAQDFDGLLADVVESATPEADVENLGKRLDELLKQYRNKMPKSKFAQLKRVLNDALALLRNQADDIKSLKAAVAALQRKAAKAEADRRAVLLGQLVYTVDDIVTSYVFGPGSRPMSLNDIQTTVEYDADVQQQQRWQQVTAFAEKQGVPIGLLIVRSSALRSQRFGVAHGRPDELDSTTPDQLRAWATSSYATATELLLKFLGPLTQDSKPLRPRQDVAATFAAP
ncbi:hypothetical protein HYH02_002584 [Chlamydomonas schloesseri]|uniref:Uncharacterized protein n=1 Tax=Chlamydomonas schloesseri TaxID=2026947 RepID=A0A836BB53_9CHLO|nr:hypothetical protein HYH02_002584 [Chlamydomonas schloesseri]|eukprot:KAG2453261.1 hypothetical protein HYH02_002584 [Chlamydomonas schloesseri]